MRRMIFIILSMAAVLLISTEISAGYAAVLEKSIDSITVIAPSAGNDISESTVTINDEYIFTGSAVVPDITVSLEGNILQEGVDYELYVSDNVGAGTAHITLTGIGSCSGSLETTFIIGKRMLEEPSLPKGVAYTGETVQVTPDCYDSAYETVTGALSGTAVGNYTATISLNDPVNCCWADGTYEPLEFTWTIGVCHIGDTYYTTLSSALLQGSNANSKIVMDCGVTESNVCPEKENYIDLNGFTVTGEQGSPETFSVGGGSTLTMENGTVENTVYRPVYVSGGTVNLLENMTVNANGSANNPTAVFVNGGAAFLNNVSLNSSCSAAGKYCYGLYIQNGGSVTTAGTVNLEAQATGGAGACATYISGGSYSLSDGTQHVNSKDNSAVSYGFILENNAQLTILGGKVEIKSALNFSYGIYVNSGTFSMSGGYVDVYAYGTGSCVRGAVVMSGSGTMSGGTIRTLCPISTESTSIGIEGTDGTNTITVTGGTVTARNGKKLATAAYKCIIQAGTFQVSGGYGTAIGAYMCDVTGGKFTIKPNGDNAYAAMDCREDCFPGGKIDGGTFNVRGLSTVSRYGFISCTVGEAAVLSL